MNLQQEDITVEPIKSVLFTITKDYFITNQEKIRTQLCNTWQVDDMILNKDSTDIKEFLYMEYLSVSFVVPVQCYLFYALIFAMNVNYYLLTI